MKVQISDVVVRTRVVELPECCPECKVVLNDDNAVEISLDWNYGEGTVVQFHEPETGAPVPAAGYFCIECGHLLAWGKHAIIDSPSRKVGQATLWSRCLDQLILTAPRS